MRQTDTPSRARPVSHVPSTLLGLLVGALVGGLCAGAVGYGVGVRRAPAVAEREPYRYSRQELKALVMGKTPTEVAELLGQPARTAESPLGQTWTYEELTRDPLAKDGQDRLTLLFFKEGVVETIRTL